MTTLWTTLKHTSKRMVSRVGAVLPPVAAAPVTHLANDYCPHCESRTTWQVNVLHRYHRCLECGNDPVRHFSSWRRSDASEAPETAPRDASAPRGRTERSGAEPDNAFEEARCRVK